MHHGKFIEPRRRACIKAKDIGPMARGQRVLPYKMSSKLCIANHNIVFTTHIPLFE